MSKFINNCVSYSESNVLKIKLLKPLLTKFNEHLVNINENSFENSKENESSFLVLNNNIKYYLFITNKSNINGSNGSNNGNGSNYKILYFFPEITTNEQSEFYMEIDNNLGLKRDNYLFEGYIYNKSTFLATDVLFVDSKLINTKYTIRQTLMNDLLSNCNLKNINGHFNINIHHSLKNENFINIFMENFIFKKELKSIEYINNHFIKTKKHLQQLPHKLASKKIIEKTKYIEVYKVYNIDTKNQEGILYIPKISDAKKIAEIFKENNEISTVIDCKWNERFYKWTPSLLQKGCKIY